jgi:branched-chain amino acid aminotransferase
MYYNEKTIVYVDGEFKKVNDTKIDAYSATIHYGLGVFEGIRAYNTPNGIKIFKGKEHYERLIHSAKRMLIEFKYTVDELMDLSYQVLEKNNFKSAYIRPLVYTGAHMSLMIPEDSHFYLCAWEWGKYLGKELVDICNSSFQKQNPRSCHMDTKTTGHYINSILAKMEAVKNGYDEALLNDIHCYVAEGTGENIFFEKDKKIYTPPLGSILPGITRATVMKLAKQNGIEITEKYFTTEELMNADSAFFTGTAVEVQGINSIDKKQFPMKWENSLGYFLAQKFHEHVNE